MKMSSTYRVIFMQIKLVFISKVLQETRFETEAQDNLKMRVVKGGSRSRSTENKTVLSQFTKNKDIMKITVHGELNIYFSCHGK